MPTITLATYPITAASTTDGDAISQDLCSPATPNVSFDVINGGLDSANLASAGVPGDPVVTFDQIQQKALCSGLMTGVTANRDYFYQLTGLTATSDLDGVDDINANYIPVTGLNLNFYLPFQVRMLLITWTCAFANDALSTDANPTLQGSPAAQTVIKFFLDDLAHDQTRRVAHCSVNGDHTISATWMTRQGAFNDKYYSGFYPAINTAAGWHSAGIRCIFNCNQTRFRGGNIKYIYFK